MPTSFIYKAGEPSKRQMAEMRRFRLAFPCYVEQHGLCAGTYVHDLHASPDDWRPCTCFCHSKRWNKQRLITLPTGDRRLD